MGWRKWDTGDAKRAKRALLTLLVQMGRRSAFMREREGRESIGGKVGRLEEMAMWKLRKRRWERSWTGWTI